jgi:redox-sensitive bicupin YhaK (pirin superfamily)
MRLPCDEQQSAVYPISSGLTVDGASIEPRTMAVLEPAVKAQLSCEADCRLVVIGGDTLATPPHMWWNFVSTSPDAIEQAAKRWEARAFPAIPGETTFTPMPAFRRMHG